MNIEYRHCRALQFGLAWTMSSSVWGFMFIDYSQKCIVSVASDQEAWPVLWYLLALSSWLGKTFWPSMRTYNNSLYNHFIKAKLVSRGLVHSTFNSNMRLQRFIYHKLGALVPPANLRPCILSLCLFLPHATKRNEILASLKAKPLVLY